jgi:hypothetical protein
LALRLVPKPVSDLYNSLTDFKSPNSFSDTTQHAVCRQAVARYSCACASLGALVLNLKKLSLWSPTSGVIDANEVYDDTIEGVIAKLNTLRLNMSRMLLPAWLMPRIPTLAEVRKACHRDLPAYIKEQLKANAAISGIEQFEMDGLKRRIPGAGSEESTP